MQSFNKQLLPALGVGLSFRAECAGDIIDHIDSFDFLEVIVETAFSGLLPDSFYTDVVGRVPVTAHGVGLSLGSLDEICVQKEHLALVAGEVERLKSPWFSEHLSFTKVQDVDAGQLLPLQRSKGMMHLVSQKIKSVAAMTSVPVLIENIAYYFDIPGDEMDEAEFVAGVAELADCGILLDVNNLYANSINHGFDATSFVDRLPESRVVEVHVAGGETIDDLYIDTHGHPVNQPVFELLEYVCRTKSPKAVVLEREKNIPSIDILVEEIESIKSIWEKANRHLSFKQRA